MLHEVAKTLSDPHDAQISAAEASAMARSAIKLFERWGVSDAEAREILGGLAPRTYARWKAGETGRIDRDLGTRLSLLMGIHKALRYMFTDPARGYAWVKRPNAAFDGRTPVDVMAEGSLFALARMRSYLDAERGGW